MACAVPQKQGFDQWLEQVLGSERESVLAQFQLLISKRLELHHAKLISQIEMQLAIPSSQDIQELTEDVPQERAEDERGPQPDTRMQTASTLHTKYAPNEDLVADATWSHIGALGVSDQQGNNASWPPGGGIPSASFRTANQNTNTSIVPSGRTEVDNAPINISCPALPKEMTAGFLDERPDNSPGHRSPFSSGTRSPLRRKNSYKNQRLQALAAQGAEPMEGADCWLRLVNSKWFESFVVLVIFLNCMTLVLEAQYVGENVGRALGYRNYIISASARLPWVKSTLQVAQFAFNTIFLIELFLRIGAYRQDLWRHPVLACDLLLLVISAADLIVAGLFGGINPAAIRCIRMLKLIKMIRFLRNLPWMSSLFLIIRSMTACVNALLWSLTLLALLQTCVGLGLFQVLHKFLEDSSKDLDSRKLVFKYFGTFGRTMVTMYEVSVGNWAPVCRVLMEEVNEWAVFIAETGRIAASDDQIAMMRKEQNKEMLAQKLQVIFEELDESGDGFVNQREFKQLTDTVMRKYLSTLDVDVDDVKQLFKILDDGDGNISCEEFCKGIVMVKGQAKAIDMIRVAKCVQRIESKVDIAIANNFGSNG